MEKSEIEEMLEKWLDIAENRIVEKLKNSVFERKQTPPATNVFKRTENVLYAKNRILRIIEDKQEELDELKRYGLRHESQSVVVNANPKMPNANVELELVEKKIARLTETIKSLGERIAEIENALDKIRNDKFYDIIVLKYFDGMSVEDIALRYNCDASTISRRKNKLVNELKMELFPAESVEELMGDIQ